MGVNHSDKHSSLKNRNLPYLFQMLYSCREVKASGPVFNATKLLLHLEFLSQLIHITCSKACTIFFFHSYHSQATVSWELHFRINESTSVLYKGNTSCLPLVLPFIYLDLFNFNGKLSQGE